MGNIAYIKVKGTVQGDIEGSSTRKTVEGWSEVHVSSHSVNSMKDPQTGKAIQRHVYQPFSFAKPMDAASPGLFKALTTNETLDEVKIHFYASQLDGGPTMAIDKPYWVVTLRHAQISSITVTMDDVRRLDADPPMELIQLRFAQIHWDFEATDAVGATKKGHADSWDLDHA